MKSGILPLSLWTALLIQSCGGPSGRSTIQGTITGAEEVLVARVGTERLEYLDTLTTTNGSFEYIPASSEEVDIYMIEGMGAFRLSLLLSPGEQIEVQGDASQPSYTFQVSGSEDSERLMGVNQKMGALIELMDSLDAVNTEQMQSEDYPKIRRSLDSCMSAEMDRTASELAVLVEQEPDALSNLFIFPLTMGRMQLLPPDKYFSQYEGCSKAINTRYPGNVHAQRFSQRVQSIKSQIEAQEVFKKAEENAAVGQIVPDLHLPGPNGVERALSDLRGNIVLVDFWASWCRPCRAESPELVRMYSAYNEKGFEIFSVSLDGTERQPNAKEAWINAIADDGLYWPNHVSDLQGWNASSTRLYGFQSIPFTLLLDRDGKILGRGLRGAPLEAAIQNALK